MMLHQVVLEYRHAAVHVCVDIRFYSITLVRGVTRLVHLTMKRKQSSGMPQATTKWRHQEARLAEAVRKDDTASQFNRFKC